MSHIVDRRMILAGFASILAAGHVDLLASPQQGVETHSLVANLKGLPVELRPYGEVRKYVDGPASGMKHLLVTQTVLKPMVEPHPPHTHPDAEILIVVEGHGEISLMGKTSPATTGSFIYAAPNDLHGIRNLGMGPLTYYVFRWTPA